jgi:GTP-binding protein
MEIHQAVFHSSHTDLKSMPDDKLVEYAFVGRSNVGKSSLINNLCKRHNMAHTSSTPGKTQCINFFTINNKWYLVDLPGYGYAKVSKDRREKFTQMIMKYVAEREKLRQVFVLIDSRIPAQKIDMEFVEFLIEEKIPYTIIFTKMDKSKKLQREATLRSYQEMMMNMGVNLPDILMSSSVKGTGRTEILEKLDYLHGDKEEE